MDPSLIFLNLIGCAAIPAFFAAFVLTFWPGKIRLKLAAVLYGIGIISSPSPYFYFCFVHGATNPFAPLPILGWLWPILFLCFAIAAALLLWPVVSPNVAFKCGIVLFFVIAPVLIVLKMLPEYFRHHGPMFLFDFTWLVYAIVWFRIHETFQKQLALC